MVLIRNLSVLQLVMGCWEFDLVVCMHSVEAVLLCYRRSK